MEMSPQILPAFLISIFDVDPVLDDSPCPRAVNELARYGMDPSLTQKALQMLKILPARQTGYVRVIVDGGPPADLPLPVYCKETMDLGIKGENLVIRSDGNEQVRDVFYQ